eukprot:4341145-Amphidinium_carterae.1
MSIVPIDVTANGARSDSLKQKGGAIRCLSALGQHMAGHLYARVLSSPTWLALTPECFGALSVALWRFPALEHGSEQGSS